MLNKIVNGITKGGYVVFDHIPDHVIVNVKIPMGMRLRMPITARQGISGRDGSNCCCVFSSIFLMPSPIASINMQSAVSVLTPSGDESISLRST